MEISNHSISYNNTPTPHPTFTLHKDPTPQPPDPQLLPLPHTPQQDSRCFEIPVFEIRESRIRD